MTSRRQIEANRRNAKKSTGPKSRAGKRRASKNALRHGLHRKIDMAEILPFYEVVAGDEGYTIDSLATEPRARLAYRLAETEARLADVIRIEGKVWQDMSAAAVSAINEKPPTGQLTPDQELEQIRQELSNRIELETVTGKSGKEMLSILTQMVKDSGQKLPPSLIRRYRNEAETNRHKLLNHWTEGLDSEPHWVDAWFDATYQEVVRKRNGK